MGKISLNVMEKFRLKIPYRNREIKKIHSQYKTSMTMFTPSQNPTNFERILMKLLMKLDELCLEEIRRVVLT